VSCVNAGGIQVEAFRRVSGTSFLNAVALPRSLGITNELSSVANLKNGVHLITYPDSLGLNIPELHRFLISRLGTSLVGVHLLPFYPSSADRGFAPITYREVDECFGSWEDVEALGEDFELTVDFMVNHVSARSSWFLDWKDRGSDSPWAGLFIPVDSLYPHGVPEEDRMKIYTRKPRDPWVPVAFSDGTVHNTWCTFSEEQIDIDVFSRTGRKWLHEELTALARRGGVKTVRLDAAGYATKKPGTRFFFEEPEIIELFDCCRSVVSPLGVELLPEVHEHHSYQERLAGWGLPVYDFALPMLILYACYAKDASPLARWLEKCPRNCITTLDTHDGIGVVDVADLLSEDQIDFTVESLYGKGSSVNRRYSSEAYGNLDLYQINCTYYSALGEDDDAYLAARAVQFFAPGIPQVYYVGLLAGLNDIGLVEKTRQGRDINRHFYSIEEAEEELQRPVVKRLMKLMEFRNTCKAFEGNHIEVILEAEGERLHIRRWNGAHSASLSVDFRLFRTEVDFSGPDGQSSFDI